MPIGNALMIALSGFLVVFLMLVLLWGILVLINKAVSAMEKTVAAETPAPVQKPAPVPAPVKAEPKPHEIYGGEIALYNVDEKTAACLMAIVSDTSGIPLDQLIFKSIKALD
jgi:oxaloacetate decarboxylase gamma subunit